MFEGFKKDKNKKSENFQIDQDLLEKENSERLARQIENSLNENLLEQVIEEIDLPNLTIGDLHNLQRIQILKEELLGKSYIEVAQFEKLLSDFLQKIEDTYSEEELQKSAFYHILVGSDIPEDVEYLDLEGEDYSIENFLKKIESEP
jgi:hypothetical protein